MSDDALEDALRDAALKFLARRDHSAGELRAKLVRKIRARRTPLPPGNSARAVASVIGYLLERNYLDDRRFALALARRSRSSHHCGDARIRSDLKRRGIDARIISSVLAEIPDRSDALQEAVACYIKRCGPPDGQAGLQRLFRHLVRLGHAPAEARGALASFFKKTARATNRT
ncbi:MAG: RecX family transcriptional regulator [Acidobacteria bacterium]|nr:RecX family transcriptional regulator [Acidobacteriota bacterium]